MADERTPVRVGFRRFAALTLAVGACLCAVGYLPTRALGGPEAVWGMAFGCAISLIASLAGALPMVCLRLSGAGALLAPLAVRFTVALGLVLPAALWLERGRVALLLWMAVSYSVLLVVDTRYALATQAATG